MKKTQNRESDIIKIKYEIKNVCMFFFVVFKPTGIVKHDIFMCLRNETLQELKRINLLVKRVNIFFLQRTPLTLR